MQITGIFRKNYSNKKIISRAFASDILYAHVLWIVAEAYLEPHQASTMERLEKHLTPKSC